MGYSKSCSIFDRKKHKRYYVFSEKGLGPSVLPQLQLYLHHNVRHIALYSPAKFQ